MRKYLLPVIALGLLGFAVFHVVRAQQTPPKGDPPRDPGLAPFVRSVAGAGVVEARSENVAVGAPLPGVVEEVFVAVGNQVKKGDPLFRLDDRQLNAERAARQAALRSAKAQLAKLEEMPRTEELPPAEAKLREAAANRVDQEQQVRRVELVGGAATDEERTRRRQGLEMARQQEARSRADLELLKAGAWAPDKEIARAAVVVAEAQLKQTETELDRLVVRAPIDGEVLQKNVRPGEYVGAPPGLALIVLGDTSRLHVRVDFDEHDLGRLRTGAPAKARPRGEPEAAIPLSFVRVEPLVVPKSSLTGAARERVDTRVLQVIYAVDGSVPGLYVG